MSKIDKLLNLVEEVNEFTPRFNTLDLISNDPGYEKVEDNRTGAFAYVNKERITAYGFRPKAKSNPSFKYKFKSIDDMDKYVQDFFNRVSSRKDDSAKNRENRRGENIANIKNLQVGDVLVYSWGYDQTNIDFFEVIKVGDKSFVMREIYGKRAKTDDTYSYQDALIPATGDYKGEPQTKTSFSMPFGTLSKWNGKPEYQTAAGYGH